MCYVHINTTTLQDRYYYGYPHSTDVETGIEYLTCLISYNHVTELGFKSKTTLAPVLLNTLGSMTGFILSILSTRHFVQVWDFTYRGDLTGVMLSVSPLRLDSL